jgi:hypothetical protein
LKIVIEETREERIKYLSFGKNNKEVPNKQTKNPGLDIFTTESIRPLNN